MITQNVKMAVGGVAILILAGGVAFWLFTPGDDSANDVEAGTGTGTPGKESTHGQPVRVHVVKPQQGGVERMVTRPGTVHPFQYAHLFTKVSGYLQQQGVDIGSRVKQGQPLAEIFAPELGADVRKAASDLKKAKALVEVMKARVAAAEADLNQARAKVGQAEADVESARAMLTLRKQEYKRVFTLAKQGALDRELVDEKYQARRAAEASERSSEKAVTTAKAGVAAAQANLASARADLQDAQAQIEVAAAVLSRAQIWVDYTHIRSPYTGIITQRGFHEGDFIRAGTASGTQTPVLTVTRTDLMRIVVWGPDPAVPYTRAGETATLQVDALPGRTFTGKVARTAGVEDPGSRTMRTEIDLPNPDDVLKDGMYGKVTLHLGKTHASVAIPSAALVGTAKDGKRAAFVVRNGHAHRVSVQVGLDDGIRAEALSGIRPDDEVIVQHSPGLSDNVPVEVVGESHARAKDGG